MIDSLRLGPSIHPFLLPSPLPRPTSRFSSPSLIPQIAKRSNRVAQSACGRVEGQQAKRADLRPIDKPFVPKGPRTPGTGWWQEPAPVARSVGERSRALVEPSGAQRLSDIVPFRNQRLALFLPRFYPAFTLMAAINRFYPVFTPFWRVKCVGVKRWVKTG